MSTVAAHSSSASKVLEEDQVSPVTRVHALKLMQKLVGTFGILPSSFVLPPRTVKCAATPLAAGSFSEVYGAKFQERSIVVKTLRTYITGDHESAYKVSFCSRVPKRSFTLGISAS